MPVDDKDPRPIRALLVEDNPGDVELVRDRLENDEHRPIEVETAGSLGEALRLLDRGSFDVVLLDLGMPDSQGIDTLEQMRAAVPAVPVLVVTGHDDRELASRCFELGALGYLVKGRSEGALVQVIHSTVAGAAATRAAEEAYQDLRSMADGSSDAIVNVGSDGLVRFSNATAHRLFGDDVAEGRAFSHAPPRAAPGELEVEHDDGSLRVLELRRGESRWHGEEVSVLSMRDVTERKRAEQHLAHLNRVLGAIRKVNQLIVREKSRDRLVEKACRLLVETRGYTRAWIALGTGADADVVEADGLGDKLGPFRRALLGGRWPACRPIALRAGQVATLVEPDALCAGCLLHEPGGCTPMCVASLEHDGKSLGLLGIAAPADIEVDEFERELIAEVASDIGFALGALATQERRRESEEQFRAIFDKGPVAQSIVSLDGTWVRVNEAMAAMLGRSVDELVGCSIAEHTHPDDVAASFDALEELVAGGETLRLKKRYVRADGATVWCAVGISLVRDAEHTPRHAIATIVDVTVAREAEAELRRERDFASSLVETAQAIVLVLDPEGRIVTFNPYMEQLTGHALADVSGKDWFSTFLPERTRERTRAQFAQALAGDQTRGNIDALRTRDGRELLVEWYDKTMRDPAGRCVGLLCLGQDVTARERAAAETQALLRATRAVVEEQEPKRALRRIFDEVSDVLGAPAGYVALRSPDGAHNEVVFLESGGLLCTVDPSLPMPIRGLRADAYAAGRAVYDNDYARSPHWALMPEGHVALESVLFVPLSVEGVAKGLLGLANKPSGFDERDARLAEAFGELAGIALHRSEAARSLAESEASYRLLADHVQDVIWTADLDLRITYVSPSQELLTGYTPAETLGRRATDLLTDASAGKVLAMLAEGIERAGSGDGSDGPASGSPVRAVELEHVRKDGSRGWVEVRTSPVPGPDGKPRGFVGVTRDVSEKRALQSSVAQADRLASMGMLAAGVAHEINNPLSYVLYNLSSACEDLPALTEAMRRCHRELSARVGAGEIETLLGERSTVFNPAMFDDLRERVQEALSGTERIRDISRALGAFARVERNAESEIDLHQAIDHAVTMARNEVKYRARLVKDFGRLPAVVATEGKMAQVFLNLIVNAAHAIDEGAVDHNEIRIRTRVEPDAVVAEVSDTGRGIEAEHLARVFEPFFTTKEVGVGSGLGLAICKNIVTGFGGTIAVESEVGRGTTVRVALPVRPAPPSSGAEPTFASPSSEPGAARGRILVVDDEPGVRRELGRILGKAHDVVLASSGEEARDILKADEQFDLIFCDVMMPAMSGMDLHAWLVGRAPALAARLVFVTGGAFTPRARDYLAKVDNLRVDKPFEAADIRKIARDLVRASRARGGA